MNKTILYLFLFTCFLYPSFGQIHPDLQPYRDRFVDEARARGIAWTKPAPARMDFFEKDDLRFKGIYLAASDQIYLNRRYWDTATDEQREKLAFHELAHRYLASGEVRHIKNDIMNPNAVFGDYAENRKMYLDILFAEIYETPVENRTFLNLSLAAGDILIASDTPDDESPRVYLLDGNILRMKTLLDSITRNHRLYDFINKKARRFKTFRYEGCNPVIRPNEKITEIWGEGGRMYLYQTDPFKAPVLGNNARVRWNERTEMELVVGRSTFPVKSDATILWYVRHTPSESESRNLFNIPQP